MKTPIKIPQCCALCYVTMKCATASTQNLTSYNVLKL